MDRFPPSLGRMEGQVKQTSWGPSAPGRAQQEVRVYTESTSQEKRRFVPYSGVRYDREVARLRLPVKRFVHRTFLICDAHGSLSGRRCRCRNN
jgi:hypothetical protein